MNKQKRKGQVDVTNVAVTLVVAGILFVVGVLVFSNVSNKVAEQIPTVNSSVVDETFAILSGTGQLAAIQIRVNGVTAISNATVACAIGTTCNFSAGGVITANNGTFLNSSDYVANYSVDALSSAGTTAGTIQSTVLDSFDLGVIALIVLAAVSILGILFLLGGKS